MDTFFNLTAMGVDTGLHGFSRFAGQAACFNERSDSEKYSRNAAEPHALLQEIGVPVERIAALLHRHRLEGFDDQGREKIALKATVQEVLFPKTTGTAF